MRWNDIGDTRCPIARTLAVVGDRWTLLVVREAFLRARRFEEFHARTGATRHVVADRLERLVEHGILKKVPYQERPVRYEYRLTEKGVDLYPIISALRAWGDRHAPDPAGPLVEVAHRSCGHVVEPVLTCPECGERVHARDMRVHRVDGVLVDEGSQTPPGTRGR